MNITDFITIGGLVIFGLWVIYILRKVYYDLKRERMIKGFVAYSAVLDYFLEKAYEIIHKDQVLIYSLEATTLPDDEFNKVSKEFLRLAQKVMGPSLLKEFTIFYGDYETLVFNMAEYFSSKHDQDEIRKSAIEDMMETEVDTEVT